MTEDSLGPFFREMRSFLRGETEHQHLTSVLGQSASGASRLALYPMLVARQRKGVLDGLFSAVRVACTALREGLWEEIVSDFARRQPPRHWDPNQFGATFSDYLVERRVTEPTLPQYLEELADYCYARFQVKVAKLSDDDIGLGSSLLVRHYSHDVHAFWQATVAGGELSTPQKIPTTLLVFWSRTLASVFVARPSIPALLALQRRMSPDAKLGAESLASVAAIDAAEAQLVAWGALPLRGSSSS